MINLSKNVKNICKQIKAQNDTLNIDESIPNRHKFKFLPTDNHLASVIEQQKRRKDAIKASSVNLDDKIIEIFKKTKSYRTEEDVEYCFEKLNKIEFIKTTLKKFGKEKVLQIFKCINYFELSQDSNLFKIGEFGYNCYILFEGFCEVLIPESIKTENGIIFDNLRINIINPGSILGDKALIDNKLRNANVKTLTHCLLGEISKKDFLSIFDNKKKVELTDEINFFRSSKLFVNCNKGFIEKIAYMMKLNEYNWGEIVVNQNDEINKIYLIRKGVFQIEYKSEKNLETVFNINYFSNANEIDHQRFTNSRQHELKGFKLSQSNYKIFNIATGEIFGDFEMISNKNKSNFSLKCAQSGSEILEIERDKFLYVIGLGLFSILKEIVEEKIEKFKVRFKDLISQEKISEFNEKNKFICNVGDRVKINEKIGRINLRKLGRNKSENFKIEDSVKYKFSMKNTNSDHHEILSMSSRDSILTYSNANSTEGWNNKSNKKSRVYKNLFKISNSSLKGDEEYIKERVKEKIISKNHSEEKYKIFQLNKFNKFKTNNLKNTETDFRSSSLIYWKECKSGNSRLKMARKSLKSNSINTFIHSTGTTTINSVKQEISEMNCRTDRAFKKEREKRKEKEKEKIEYGVLSSAQSSINIRSRSNAFNKLDTMDADNELFEISRDPKKVAVLKLNLNCPQFLNSNSIFKKNFQESNKKLFGCAEISKKIYLEKETMSKILKNKYNFIKRNCTAFIIPSD